MYSVPNLFTLPNANWLPLQKIYFRWTQITEQN